MKKITIKTMTQNSNIPAALIRATIKQIGGFEEFKDCAPDVVSYGANNGTSGFTYYTETVDFTKKNKKYILTMAIGQSKDYGSEGAYDMIKNFGLLCNQRGPMYTEIEIYQAIHERNNENQDAVYDVLAKYTLEEVARLYVDLTEQS